MMAVSGTRLMKCVRTLWTTGTMQLPRPTAHHTSVSIRFPLSPSALPHLGPLGPPAGYRVHDIIPVCKTGPFIIHRHNYQSQTNSI